MPQKRPRKLRFFFVGEFFKNFIGKFIKIFSYFFFWKKLWEICRVAFEGILREILGWNLGKTEQQFWWKSWKTSWGFSGENIAWVLENVLNGNLGRTRNPRGTNWRITRCISKIFEWIFRGIHEKIHGHSRLNSSR